MMAERLKYSRFKFNVRRGNLECIGQKQTMRGTYYPSKLVSIPLAGRTAAELKKAMAKGIAELNE